MIRDDSWGIFGSKVKTKEEDGGDPTVDDGFAKRGATDARQGYQEDQVGQVRRGEPCDEFSKVP